MSLEEELKDEKKFPGAVVAVLSLDAKFAMGRHFTHSTMRWVFSARLNLIKE